jgi:hypothetical protein
MLTGVSAALAAVLAAAALYFAWRAGQCALFAPAPAVPDATGVSGRAPGHVEVVTAARLLTDRGNPAVQLPAPSGAASGLNRLALGDASHRNFRQYRLRRKCPQTPRLSRSDCAHDGLW